MNKKIMLVALVLLAILTIGAVSASDDADDLAATEIGGDNLDVDPASPDDEILGSEDAAAAVSDDGDGDGEGEDLHSVTIYHEIDIDRDYDDVASYWFNKNFTGTVAIRFNDTEVYNETLRTDDEIWLTVEDLELDKFEYGIYNVQFIYSGDNNNDNFTISDTVDLTYTFRAYIEDDDDEDYIPYGSSVWYYVRLPSWGNGTFSCTFNGEERVVPLDAVSEDGYLKFDAEIIAYGQNNLTFKYYGDGYPLKTINSTFTTKSIADIPSSIVFDEPLVIKVTLPKDANDYLNVYEMDKEYVGYDIDDISSINCTGYYVEEWGEIWAYNLTLLASAKVNNGTGFVSLSNLSFGEHGICVNYTGNYEMRNTRTVIVTPGFIIPDRVWINATSTGQFRLPENYNGNLTVGIGNESRSFDVVNGSATFDLFNLDYIGYAWWYSSSYRILRAYYSYQDNENGAEFYDSKTITVMLIPPQINLEQNYASQVVVKDLENYYTSFAISGYAGGNMTVYVDGNYYSVVDVDYGCYVDIDVSNLTFGKHEVRFEYSGDDYFEQASAYDYFTVTHVDFRIPQEVIIGKYYENEYGNYVYVSMMDNLTGEAKLLVDGVEKETKQLTDSQNCFDLSNLTYGNHTVTIIYQNGNYATLNKTSIVEAKYSYGLVFDDLTYGHENAYAVLPIGATGTVKANISGKEFSANIDENGIARFNVSGIPEGEYLTTLTYAGDGKYPAGSETFNLTVEYRIVSNIHYDDEIYVDDLENYTINLALPEDAEGKLLIYDDWDYYDSAAIISKDLVNGTAQVSLKEIFEAKGSRFGSYEIRAIYRGSDYDVYSRSFEININGYVITYPENSENIVLGQAPVYTVRLSGNHTGYFQVWGGKKYRNLVVDNISIVDGVAAIAIPTTTLGSQYFRLLYVGDDVEFENDVYVIVAPENITLAGKASGNDAILTVQLPDDASGVLTAYMYSSKSGDLMLNSTYKGSIATINASDIPKGTWTLSYFTVKDEKYGTYSFASTSKYYENGFYGDFKVMDQQVPVIPVSADLTATAKDIKNGEEAVIDISINANVSGKVLVGDKVVDIKGGKGVFKIPNLAVGTYKYTVSFEGDLHFINATVTVSFKVLTDPKITAKDTSVLYTANGKYSVTVYGTDGKAVNKALVIFKINGKQVGKGYTNTKGVATYVVKNVPGTYKIVASALGTSVTKKVTVKHLVTLYSTTFQKSAKKITFKAKLAKVNGKVLQKKTITFKVNGKKVATAKTDKKGVATIILKDTKATKVLKTLKAGKKATYTASYLKDTVKKTTTIKK